MGRGQRHSKNAGVMGSEALTYHERKALGFGTVRERVGKVGMGRQQLLRPGLPKCSTLNPSTPLPPQDSQSNYYDCRLTLQPAVVSSCTQRTSSQAAGLHTLPADHQRCFAAP
jgi:nitric oxide synthase-interacting protein